MEVQQVLDSVRRHMVIVTVVALVAALLAVAGTALAPAKYTATARGLVSVGSPATRSPNVLTSGSLYILARMSSYAALGTSGQVLDAVRTSQDLDQSTEDLGEQITSTAVVDTAFVEVSVTDRSPAAAARIANGTVDEVARVVEGLENGTVHLKLSNPATAPEHPSNRGYLVNAVVALAAGLVLGVVFAVVVDARRRRARTE